MTSIVRRYAYLGTLAAEHAEAAITDFLDLPITVYPTAPLLPRVWDLRANLTAYDACYVALAEAIGCPLATADRRLANLPGVRCEVEAL